MLPAPGGPSDQTQFTKELFDYIDNLINKYRIKQHKKAQSEMKSAKSK